MKIALCQMKNAGTLSENLKKSIDAMKKAAECGADLILFPEVCLPWRMIRNRSSMQRLI